MSVFGSSRMSLLRDNTVFRSQEEKRKQLDLHKPAIGHTTLFKIGWNYFSNSKTATEQISSFDTTAQARLILQLDDWIKQRST
jgi:hypothetical protein